MQPMLMRLTRAHHCAGRHARKQWDIEEKAIFEKQLLSKRDSIRKQAAEAYGPQLDNMVEEGKLEDAYTLVEEMLEKVSVYLEDKFQSSTKITMNLLEPLIVVFLGLFVALIVLAILLPLIQLNTLTLN